MDFDAENQGAQFQVGAGEAFGAAEAGEAVDAAVGLARYSPHRPQRAPQAQQRPLYTYMVGLPVGGPPTATTLGVSSYRVNNQVDPPVAGLVIMDVP